MRHKRAGIITKLVVMIFMVYATVTLINLRIRIDEAEKVKTEKAQEVQEGKAINAALQYEIEHRDDPKTIENIARDKLGLLKPGEKVFYGVSN